MFMKKCFAFLVFILLLNIFYISVVQADTCDERPYQCIKCSYDNGNFVYVVYSDGAGNAKIDEAESQKYKSSTFRVIDNVKGADFINEDSTELSCPYIRRVYDTSQRVDVQDESPYVITASQAIPSIKDKNLEKVFSPTSSGPTNKPFISDVGDDVKANKTCLFVDTTHLNHGESLKIRATYNGTDFDFDVPSGYKANIPRGESLEKLKEEFKKSCSEMKVRFLFVDDDDTGEKIVEIVVGNISGSHEIVSMDNISDPDTIDQRSGFAKDDFTPGELCKDGACDISLSGFCSNPPVKATLRFLGILLVIAKILVPIIIIAVGVISLVRAIIAGKEDETKKYIYSVIKRVLVGVVIFLLPGIIDFVFDTVSGVVGVQNSSVSTCEACILDVDNCK